jgi:hypothetical protein
MPWRKSLWRRWPAIAAWLLKPSLQTSAPGGTFVGQGSGGGRFGDSIGSFEAVLAELSGAARGRNHGSKGNHGR